MKQKVKIGVCCCLLTCAIQHIHAQALNYEGFLQKVSTKNTELLSEQYNVPIAEANLQAAKVFPDPELSVSYSNNEDWSMQMGQSLEVGLEYSFSLGNVRRAEIRVARSEKELAGFALADYMRNLRYSASEAYADAWLKLKKAEIGKSGYEDMRQIAWGDSIRLAHGDINSTDALQSNLEAQSMHNDYLKAQAEYLNSLTNLSTLVGGESISGIEGLVATEIILQMPVHTLPELCNQARLQRSDLKAALSNKELSQQNLRLVKASQALDLTISAAYAHNREALNEIAPSPTHNSYTVGIAIPLKFSSMNKGARTAAKLAIEQSEMMYQTVLQQIDAEVVQAYNTYQAARQVMLNYESDILKNARQVLENRKAGYQVGETDILELLMAQRTYQEVMNAYYEAYADAFLAQQNLQRAVGQYEL